MKCKYCYNTGRILVELGSSQSYPCPDCRKTETEEEPIDEPIPKPISNCIGE